MGQARHRRPRATASGRSRGCRSLAPTRGGSATAGGREAGDLVAAAVNQAMAKARQMYLEEMKTLAGGLELPGLDTTMEQLLNAK